MQEMYAFVVALTVVAHLLFVGYLVSGGWLALRWRRTIGLHVAAVIWGIGSAAGHVGCPLTGLERWARHRAEMPPLSSKGFIDHYLTGVLYPAGWVTAVQVSVFAVVAISWTVYVWRGSNRDAAARATVRRSAPTASFEAAPRGQLGAAGPGDVGEVGAPIQRRIG